MKKLFIAAMAVFFLSVAPALTVASEHGVETEKGFHADVSDEEPEMDMDAAHDGHDMDDMSDEEHVHKEAPAEVRAKVGIDEKLGETVPMNLKFKDSNGVEYTLGELLDKPTLIAPVYYSCPNVCNFLQSRLASIIPELKMKPGEDYQVLSISFDELDTPEIAKSKKANYIEAIDGDFPADQWKFLTADKDTIMKMMNSIGFGFLRDGRDFIHSVIVVAVSDEGKIVRYLYGTDILPFEMTMAATEAAKGEVGLSVRKVLSLCFSYDAENKKYVFNFMRVTGTIVLIFIALFLFILFKGGRRND